MSECLRSGKRITVNTFLTEKRNVMKHSFQSLSLSTLIKWIHPLDIETPLQIQCYLKVLLILQAM